MEILNVVCFCIGSAVILRLLSDSSPGVRTVCTIAAACAVGARFITGLRELYSAAEQLLADIGSGSRYLVVVFKCLGICFLTQLGTDICRDSGENALASQLELAGRAAVLTAAIPLFSAAAETVRVLLNV